ncbi:MAG: bacteriophage Gp15 family protein [Oscillospiraceae bacterium]|nr:bacteriophage Gp15 family protein [Oscillospiraceae bacterium]
MNRLLESPKTKCKVDGVEYVINEHYSKALWAWKAYEAFEVGKIDSITYVTALVENMFLDPVPSIWCAEAVQLASDYLNSFGDKDDRRKSNMPPYGYIAIEQDSDMIFSALLTKGVNVKRDDVTFDEFLAHLRDLPEGCEYANIMRLRAMWYDNRAKMTKADHEAIKRIGKKRILVRDARVMQREADNAEYFKALREKMLAERG